MTSGNASDADVTQSDEGFSLLWLPYVAIALLCAIFLAVNFAFYHRKVRERYRRKCEELAMHSGVHPKRRILALMHTDHFCKERHDEEAAGAQTGTAFPAPAPPPGEVTPVGLLTKTGEAIAAWPSPHPGERTAAGLLAQPGETTAWPSPQPGERTAARLSVLDERLPSPLGEDELHVTLAPTSPPPPTPPYKEDKRAKKKRRILVKFRHRSAHEGGAVVETPSLEPSSKLRWRDGPMDDGFPRRSKTFGGNLVISTLMNSLHSSATSRSESD